MIFLGVDPGLRKTGLARYEEGQPIEFQEISTNASNLLGETAEIRAGFRNWLNSKDGRPFWFTMERQLSTGGESAALMFHVQMLLLEEFEDWTQQQIYEPKVSLPLPVQLRSYMKRRWNVDLTNGTSVVKSYKEITKRPGRISKHCVDAFFLTQMGKDIFSGNFHYKLPTKELTLVPWEILNGQC